MSYNWSQIHVHQLHQHPHWFEPLSTVTVRFSTAFNVLEIKDGDRHVLDLNKSYKKPMQWSRREISFFPSNYICDMDWDIKYDCQWSWSLYGQLSCHFPSSTWRRPQQMRGQWNRTYIFISSNNKKLCTQTHLEPLSVTSSYEIQSWEGQLSIAIFPAQHGGALIGSEISWLSQQGQSSSNPSFNIHDSHNEVWSPSCSWNMTAFIT